MSSLPTYTSKLALLLLILVQFQLADAFPLLSRTVRLHHQHRHHRHAPPDAFSDPEPIRKSVTEMAKLRQNDDAGPQIVGMRVLNTGSDYWGWIESESHSLYVFAFTYFGTITLLLVLLLIMTACCYMYDCMGCYEQHTWTSKKYGSEADSVAKCNQNNKIAPVADNRLLSKMPRRWSSPMVVQL